MERFGPVATRRDMAVRFLVRRALAAFHRAPDRALRPVPRVEPQGSQIVDRESLQAETNRRRYKEMAPIAAWDAVLTGG